MIDAPTFLSEPQGPETKQPENGRGDNAPSPDIDDSAGDSLADAFDACDGEIELLETCERNK